MRGFLIGLLLAALPSLSWSDSIQQLQDELKQQKFSRAATTGLALLRQQPDNIQALFLTALAFHKNQQPEQAARYYREIIDLQPSLPEPHNNLAMIEMQRGNHDQAVNLLIASLQTHPAYATAWQNLSNLYRGLASEAYRKALSEDNNPSAVIDQIQLQTLNELHNLPPAPTITRPVMVAENKPAPDKPVAQSRPQSVKIISQKTLPLKPQLAAISDDALIAIIEDWANAWSSKDFERYVNAYSADFKGRNKNHAAWVKYRRARILRAGEISVEVSNARVKSRSSQRAIIDFHQAFKSPNYRDKVAKRIVLDRQGQRWLISSEKTLAVL